MKIPYFRFFPSDWRRNANLAACTQEQKGAWMDVLCLLYDSDECGVLRWPLSKIAKASGSRLSSLRALAANGVLKGTDSGVSPAFEYRPYHAGKEGAPLIILAECQGPIWYSSRIVRDEHVRSVRGNLGDTEYKPKVAPKVSPKPPPKGAPNSHPPANSKQHPSSKGDITTLTGRLANGEVLTSAENPGW